MSELIAVRIHERGRCIYVENPDLDLYDLDPVIVETAQGLEYGVCEAPASAACACAAQQCCSAGTVLRLAEAQDEDHYQDNCRLEKDAYARCKEAIARRDLPMVLVDAEYLFDRSRLIFYFTADGRVDFRELVKDLASIFHTRIELRQIGVRDEAGMMGGLGICGRELCCCSFMRNFQPVSIKMAKEQNLSMNPSKISGACGRLLCCLKYEEEAYTDAVHRLPARGDRVNTPQGSGTVVSVNLLREILEVRLDDEDADILSIPAAEVSGLQRKGERARGERARKDGAARPSRKKHEEKRAAEEADQAGETEREASWKNCPHAAAARCTEKEAASAEADITASLAECELDKQEQEEG